MANSYGIHDRPPAAADGTETLVIVENLDCFLEAPEVWRWSPRNIAWILEQCQPATGRLVIGSPSFDSDFMMRDITGFSDAWRWALHEQESPLPGISFQHVGAAGMERTIIGQPVVTDMAVVYESMFFSNRADDFNADWRDLIVLRWPDLPHCIELDPAVMHEPVMSLADYLEAGKFRPVNIGSDGEPRGIGRVVLVARDLERNAELRAQVFGLPPLA